MAITTKKTGPAQRTMVTHEMHQIHFLQKDHAKIHGESSAPTTISCHTAFDHASGFICQDGQPRNDRPIITYARVNMENQTTTYRSSS
jgi:hypothetical protein